MGQSGPLQIAAVTISYETTRWSGRIRSIRVVVRIMRTMSGPVWSAQLRPLGRLVRCSSAYGAVCRWGVGTNRREWVDLRPGRTYGELKLRESYPDVGGRVVVPERVVGNQAYYPVQLVGSGANEVGLPATHSIDCQISWHNYDHLRKLAGPNGGIRRLMNRNKISLAVMVVTVSVVMVLGGCSQPKPLEVPSPVSVEQLHQNLLKKRIPTKPAQRPV